MKYEKSCGGVVYTKDSDQIRYVIIQHLGGHWGFPKGHMEPGESETTTALREILEETGIAAQLEDGFRKELQYPLPNKPGVMKQVIYFLASYQNQDIRYQKEELQAACLLSYEEAVNLLTHEDTKGILAQANAFLRR